MRLTNGPRIGRSPDGGYNSCPTQPLSDFDGVEVGPAALVAIGSSNAPALIQCQQGEGIIETESAPPSFVSFNGAIQNIGCYGLVALGGYLDVVSSSISYCNDGILVGGAQTSVDLSGGYSPVAIPRTAVSCIASQETEGGNLSDCQYRSEGMDQVGPSGASIINTGSSTIDAENVLWPRWDPALMEPPTWACDDAGYEECVCQSGGCMDSGVASLYVTQATAVYFVGNANPFDFDGGGEASATCR
jgi:hypothetical protein